MVVAAVTFVPIGVVRSPFKEKVDAPRQATAAKGVLGSVELFAGKGYEHALDDLEGWDRIWVLFVFDRNEGWKPKVLPPRSDKKHGLFATRSPHRPNPIGMSVVELVKVDGLVVHIRDLDMLDGTPVLDIKPYVPYADAFPDSRSGWLGELGETRDPAPAFEVTWSALAREQADWLAAHAIDLTTPATKALALGPQPNAYRRIRPDRRGGMQLAIKEWRVRFDVPAEGARAIHVIAIHSGYRESQLFGDVSETLAVHRAFVGRFG